MVNINARLLLRLLNMQEFFAHQWLMSYQNDSQQLSELMKIRKKQLSLKDLVLQDRQSSDEQSGAGGSSGRGTIKGLRAKNDSNINSNLNKNRKPGGR